MGSNPCHLFGSHPSAVVPCFVSSVWRSVCSDKALLIISDGRRHQPAGLVFFTSESFSNIVTLCGRMWYNEMGSDAPLNLRALPQEAPSSHGNHPSSHVIILPAHIHSFFSQTFLCVSQFAGMVVIPVQCCGTDSCSVLLLWSQLEWPSSGICRSCRSFNSVRFALHIQVTSSLTAALVVSPSHSISPLSLPSSSVLYLSDNPRLQVSYSADHLSFVFPRQQNALSPLVDLYQSPANFEDYPFNPQPCLRLRNLAPQGASDALLTGIRTDTVSPLCSVWPLNRMQTSMTNWPGVHTLFAIFIRLMCSTLVSPEAFEGSQGSHFCPVQKEFCSRARRSFSRFPNSFADSESHGPGRSQSQRLSSFTARAITHRCP